MNPFPGWLTEVTSDPLVIDTTEGGLNRETRGNLWTFAVTSEQAQSLTPEEIVSFVEAVVLARTRQLEHLERPHAMLFYCWFDEQAAQLRFSLVSALHRRLPFGSVVTVAKDLAEIAAPFLASAYHDGIPLHDFEPVAFDALAPVVPPIVVWVKEIP